jgi:hypothetical protein
VNLKLRFHIPEYLPMWGKKARVYYHGIPSFCVGCYTVGHVKADCEENSISWKDFINNLLDLGIEKRLFGSWFRSNLSLSRDTHATFAQPNLKRKTSNSNENDEDLTLETLSPKLLELFKKFQSSTPNVNRRSPRRDSLGSNSRSNSNSKTKNENRNRGRGRGRGRGNNSNNSNRDSSEKPRNRGRGRSN